MVKSIGVGGIRIGVDLEIGVVVVVVMMLGDGGGMVLWII